MCDYSSHLINRCLELSLDLLGLEWQEHIFKLRRLQAVPLQSQDYIIVWCILFQLVLAFDRWSYTNMPGRTENMVPPSLASSNFLAGIFCLAQFAQSCKQSEGLLRVFTFLRWYILDFMRSRAVKTVLSNRLIMNSRWALELTPKAQVLEGWGI